MRLWNLAYIHGFQSTEIQVLFGRKLRSSCCRVSTWHNEFYHLCNFCDLKYRLFNEVLNLFSTKLVKKELCFKGATTKLQNEKKSSYYGWCRKHSWRHSLNRKNENERKRGKERDIRNERDIDDEIVGLNTKRKNEAQTCKKAGNEKRAGRAI